MKVKKLLICLVAVCMMMPLFSVTSLAAGEKTITTNGNGGRTDVGAWFVTYNTDKMWANNFGHGFPIKYGVLLPDGTYGLPDSYNTDVIDFQIAQLAEAQIDFILFDLTNGGLTEKIPYGWDGNQWIVETAQLTCERLKIWNESHDWKVKYAVGVGVYANLRKGLSIGEAAEYQAEAVLEKFYKQYGEENYYQIGGKPLLMLHDFGNEGALTAPGGWNMYSASSSTDHDAGDQFTMRGSLSTPHEDTGYAWYTPMGGTIVTEESATVCPGQWNHANSTPNAFRENGKHYINDWKTIIESKTTPDVVLISSFNDYNEDTAVFTADTSRCDPQWEEQWFDDTGNLNASMYWEITKEGIATLRKNNKDSFADLEAVIAGNTRSWFSEPKADSPDETSPKEFPFYPLLFGMIGGFTGILIIAAVILFIAFRRMKKRFSSEVK